MTQTFNTPDPDFESCVRPLGIKDADEWATLRRRALDNHPLSFGASTPDDPSELLETARARLAPSEDAVVFGAFVGNAMVGILGVMRGARSKERHKAQVWGMYVTEAHRGIGAGKALLSAAIGQARSWSDVEQVQLSVSEAAGDAQRLYSRLGFRAWGREPLAIRWQDRYADEIHMVLDLRKAQ